MDSILPLTGFGPNLARVSEVHFTPPTPRTGAAPLDIDVSYSRDTFYTETHDVGTGPNMERLSFTDAVRRFII